MVVYFIVFFISLALSYFLPANTDVQWKRKLFWTFLPLFIFGSLRVNLGNDYVNYVDFFNEFHNQLNFVFDETSHSEIGFQLLCYIMPSHRSIIVLNTFLLCLSLALFINNNVPRHLLWLAVLLIFLNVEKNIYGTIVGLRNGLAVSISLLGVGCIQKRRWFLYALLVLLAQSFHTSAVLYMPIIYLVGINKTLTKKEVIIWIVAAFAILFSALSNLLNIVTPFLLNYTDRYEMYINNYDEGHRGLLLTLTGITLAVAIFKLFWENRKTLTSSQNSLCRLGLIYVFFTFLGSLAMRASYFYDMYFIGVVTLFASIHKQKNFWRDVLMYLAVVMSMYSMYLWATSEYVWGNPYYMIYHSILEDLW